MDSVKNNKLKLNLDLRLISAALLLIIIAMIALWRPWSAAAVSDRTITVTGDSKITAEPDEFVFMPSYEFKNADKTAALSELTKKSDEIVAELKKLGVASSKIKINSDGYDYKNYFFDDSSDQFTYTLRPTVTVGSRDLAQKVQDYLTTTTPSGQVSPQAGFSKTLQKVLEGKARDEATKDARSKADQSAKNLGFKVGKVKSFDDGSSSGGIQPLYATSALVAEDSRASTSSLAVQPGENDINYSVTVVYYIR